MCASDEMGVWRLKATNEALKLEGEMGNLRDETLKGIERLWERLDDVMFANERDTLFAATLIIKSAFANELCRYCKHSFDPIEDTETNKT